MGVEIEQMELFLVTSMLVATTPRSRGASFRVWCKVGLAA
jgi:hypothetical protein